MDIGELIGKTFTNVKKEDFYQNDGITFENNDETFALYHDQDCCESVTIEDINGDLNDLIGAPILKAEEVFYQDENPPGVPVPEYQESFTWTFYKFATIKGYVTIRFYGESNGYYGETACLHKTDKWKQDK